MHTTSAQFHLPRGTVSLMRAFIVSALLILAIPFSHADAQELRVLPNADTVHIDNPEKSVAYYGDLKGAPQTFTLNSDEPFSLFMALIVPDVPGIATDLTAEVYDNQNADVPLTVLDGREVTWQGFTDTSGGDAYLAGPTFKATIPEGSYDVRISSPDNMGQFVLIVGEERGFSLSRIFKAYNALPQIKEQYFGKQRVEAFLTPLLMWPTIIILIILGLLILAASFARSRRSSVSTHIHSQ